MLVKREPVIKRLETHLNYAISHGVSKNNIVGIFLVGSQNYGFASGDSDVDSMIIILPSDRELFFSKGFVSRELHLQDEHILVKDIRQFRLELMNQSIATMQVLYTNYFIYDKGFESMFKSFFIEPRERIAHLDVEKTFKSVCGQMVSILNKPPYSFTSLYQLHRLYYFIENYMSGKVYLDCLQMIPGPLYDYVWDIKFGLAKEFRNPEGEANYAEAEKLKAKLTDLVSLYGSNFKSPFANEAQQALDNGVKEFIQYHLTGVRSIVSKDEFFKQLTNAETQAYYNIIQNTKADGFVTIKKLYQDYPISKTVYESLINKMKNLRVAEITSHGSKGMRVVIIQPEMRIEASKA